MELRIAAGRIPCSMRRLARLGRSAVTVSRLPPLAWRDGLDLAAEHEPGRDVLELLVHGRPVGEIAAYPSAAGVWQRIHGYGSDERLWSFDVAIEADADRGRGYGSRAVRRTCEAILATGEATRVVVD